MADDFDAAQHGPHDHPAIATLLGCLLLVAGALLVPRMLPACPQATLIGAGAAAGLVLWLIGFAVTIRFSSTGWKAGSLAILIVAGALAGYLAHRQYEATGREDPSSFAEMEFGPQNVPILPGDAAARGPISRLFSASLKANIGERRALDEAIGKFGAGNLNSPHLLTQNPQVIGRCGDLDGIGTLARLQARHRAERSAEIRRAIDSSTLDATIKDAIGSIAAPRFSTEDTMLANQLSSIDATHQLCSLLAKRSWYNNNYVFGFRNAADMTQYKTLQARRSSLASEAERIDREAAERMQRAQKTIRAALS